MVQPGQVRHDADSWPVKTLDHERFILISTFERQDEKLKAGGIGDGA